MPSSNACPKQSGYVSLIRGELPSADVERLIDHLDGCPGCAAAVQTLLGEDTLLSGLRQAQTEAPQGDEVPADLTGRLLALAAPSADTSLTLQTLPPPQKPDEIARLAHYRVLKVLGQGGMGVVFLAEDTRLKRTVALKTMRPEVAADPQHRQRFLREARAAAKVEDDHIVPIYDVGEERGVPWLAMPFLKGESLDALLKRVKVLKPALTTRLGAQVARGLAAAHAAGLIHRDVKPANIWVEPTGGGRARLLDFGLARDQSPERDRGDASLTRTGALVGTPAFMAPEQAEGQPLDARADLFSLGCVLYRAVTGRLPFQGDGILGTLAALATDTPPAPCEVAPEAPQPLSAPIMNLLAKDPAARPASAAAVAAALDAIPEKPAIPVPTALPVAPRRRWRLATAAALLLALGGALTAGIVIIIKNKDGKEVGRVTLPEGVSAEIKQDGDSGKAKVNSVQLDPDRRAAEWALSIGGTIKIRLEGQEREIRAAKDLPVAPFEVASVILRDNQKVDDAQLEHLKGLTSLTWLELGATRVSDAGLEHLSGLTNLTALWLGNSQVGDAGLVHLKGLTSLTHLELGGTRVTDAGLVHLKGLTNLTELHLWNTRVSDAGLEHLKGLTNLRGIALGGTRVSDAGLERLNGLTNLTFLLLGDTRVSDAGWVHLKKLTSLKALELGGTWVSDAGLVHLKGLPNLRAILLSNTQVSDAGLEQLKGLTQLTDLHLWNTRVSDAGMERLKGLTNLSWLNLGSTRVGDAGLEYLKELTKLRILNLHGTRVSDAGLKVLAGLGNLKHLDLTGTQTTADGVAALQKALPNCKIVWGASDGSPDRKAAEWVLSIGGAVWIRQDGQDRHIQAAKDLPASPLELGHVTLHSNRLVDDGGLVRLEGLTKLAGLDLGDTRVSDAGLEHVKGLTYLTVLGLPHTRVTDAGLEHLKGLINLSWLNLDDDTDVSDAGLEHLKGLTNLKQLLLSRTRVGDLGLEHLKGLTKLTELQLDATRVRDAGLEHIKGLTNLTVLVLSNTQVGDAGLERLKGLTQLTTLPLGGTRVGDAGLEHLKGLTKLTLLNLYGTQVSDAGLKHLAGLKNLQQLDLTKTKVTADGVAELRKALPSCRITWEATAGTIDRKAAEWVLSVGGEIATEPGKAEWIKAVQNLPATPFRLVQVTLKYRPQVNDTELAHTWPGCLTSNCWPSTAAASATLA